ncbi:4-hydroxy-tetrahydrodipicolinate synthase [Bacillus solimangrovi]|uniref:4-hydroxy-tetrahydrodipicolinate synthase n=1 Tax=Bacillus solimangrovi TaxID=1305675 RepID=A0A1E5LDY3_9BACI|nr:4-hydroxy-tetrahydrodipicolinate synthase [Bacillus solimangrovi]OEH92305.1 4-hydroxy-tetrahydrodipicolinate synthase [Bacillus solimangrovi]
MDFGTIGTAMVTPFDNKGNIDFAKTTKLVEYLIQNGTTSLIVAGTTGESPTLSTEEKIALYQHVVKVVNGRIPVVAGTGSNNTRASIHLSKKAEEVGVDAIMLVVPYYNKPSQQGMYEHFKAVADAVKLPVMLYNIPGRSCVNMSVDTIVQLSEVENIVAVKEASGDLNAITEIISRTPSDFTLYSGDDSLTLPILAIGGRGIISVSSHVIGNEMSEMIASFQQGDNERAATLHQDLLPIMKAMFIAPNPAPVKTSLQICGLDVGSVRLPLTSITQEQRTLLVDLLQHNQKGSVL